MLKKFETFVSIFGRRSGPNVNELTCERFVIRNFEKRGQSKSLGWKQASPKTGENQLALFSLSSFVQDSITPRFITYRSVAT